MASAVGLLPMRSSLVRFSNGLQEEKREAEKFMLKEAELAKWSKVSCAISLRDTAQYKRELEERVEQLQKNMEGELYVACRDPRNLTALPGVSSVYCTRCAGSRTQRPVLFVVP